MVLATRVTYFSETGQANTGPTLRLARERMDDLAIDTALVATTSGKTGVLAAEILKADHLIIVTHSTGFAEPNLQQLTPENRSRIENAGGKILTCQHALGGVNRAIRMTFQTYQVDEIIANSLKLFGQGFKVCVEISLMAADAGLVGTDKPVVCLGGSGKGADTAVILKPANTHRFFDLKIYEIICRPSPGHPGLVG